MTAVPRYSLPTVPSALTGLLELALDLRWSWSHSSDVLWQELSPELWEATGNPWHILQSVAQTRLEEAAADRGFVKMLQQQLRERSKILRSSPWFEREYPGSSLAMTAYFSMEYGLGEALPIYSGGLGVLAGDFLKAASDLGVPVTGIGLMWQQGYFRQALTASGEQVEFFPFNDPGQLPIAPLRDAEGEWVDVVLGFPRRDVHLRVWEVRAGRTSLYLLDANHLLNSPADRGITSELYGGAPETRLQQEIILGIGGWRLLRALDISPEVCHLNEGHAALAVLERARCHMRDHSVSFSRALTATRAGNLFTTHTPVEAGLDRFPPSLIEEYLGSYAEELGLELEEFLSLGRPPGISLDQARAPSRPRRPAGSTEEPFNMAYLAIRGSGAVNGVSRLHGQVSRALFQGLFPRWPRPEVPVGHVTNGVHVPSWDSDDADLLWTNACGKERWLGNVAALGDSIRRLSDEALWSFRDTNRRKLVAIAREHVRRQGPVAGSLESLGSDLTCLCDPGVLTLGFARRFASYKRPNLLLHDADRLERLLCGETSRVQLVLAGKAHPADMGGKAMIKEWTDFIGRCTVRPHVIFLVDYDMGMAEHLVHGVDVWINTPRRPWEASGTSGMKVLVNGGLNLSELDGWWAEAYSADVGWALGDGREHGDDPAWDASEAGQLYDLLENEIIPEFYDRDEDGVPHRWVSRIRESMARLAPYFSTNRMMGDYLERYYLPAATAYRERLTGNAAQDIEEWLSLLDQCWSDLRFGDVSIVTDEGPHGSQHSVAVELHLGRLSTDVLRIELYADPLEGEEPERHALTPEKGSVAAKRLSSDAHMHTYRTVIPALRPASDYTPRVVPSHALAKVPLESSHILWYR
jgi:starch phosphorylase